MTITAAGPLDATDYGEPLSADDEKAMSADDLGEDGRWTSAAVRGLRKSFTWLPAEKDREGEPNRPQIVCVRSEKGENRALLWMLVENEGEAPDTSPKQSLALSIGRYVQDQGGELKPDAVAKVLGKDAQDSSFKRALSEAVDANYVRKSGHGKYAAGTASLGLLDE